MVVTTGRSGNWKTAAGTIDEVRGELSSDEAKLKDVKAMTTTGSDIKVLYWKVG